MWEGLDSLLVRVDVGRYLLWLRDLGLLRHWLLPKGLLGLSLTVVSGRSAHLSSMFRRTPRSSR